MFSQILIVVTSRCLCWEEALRSSVSRSWASYLFVTCCEYPVKKEDQCYVSSRIHSNDVDDEFHLEFTLLHGFRIYLSSTRLKGHFERPVIHQPLQYWLSRKQRNLQSTEWETMVISPVEPFGMTIIKIARHMDLSMVHLRHVEGDKVYYPQKKQRHQCKAEKSPDQMTTSRQAVKVQGKETKDVGWNQRWNVITVILFWL